MPSRRVYRMSLPAKDDIRALTSGEDVECQVSYDGRWVAYAKAKLPGGTDYHAFGSVNEVEPGMSGPPPDTARKLFEAALKRHGGRPGFTPDRPL